MLFPIESGSLVDVRYNNLFIGLGIALALLALGLGAIHWSKAIMADHEHVEYRHPTRAATRPARPPSRPSPTRTRSPDSVVV